MSFYRHEVPVNRKKTDLTINRKINKGTKKLFSRGEFVSPDDISEVEKAPIINYDFMINSDKTTSLFNNNKPKKVLSFK